jgi:two-component system cell cycle sensor histidine kinase/response regulator CckA
MTVSRLTPLQSSSIEIGPGITEDQFRRLAASLSSIVWRTNFDGTRLVAPRWAEITGKSETELHAGGWLSTIHADDRTAFSEALRTARVHGSHCEVDFRLNLRGGTCHWFHLRGEPSRDGRGQITGLIGIASNIDEQKRAEAALLENEARLRLVLEAARVGTIDHDLVANRITLGPLARSILGLPQTGEFTMDAIARQVHPDDRALFKRAIDVAQSPSANGKYEIVFRALHANGDIVWVSARGTYLFEGEGDARRAVRFVGVSSDVSGRMRELEERARLSAIVSSSNDAIISVTNEGNVTHWNVPAERMYGYAATEMLGRSVLCTVPPELVDDARARIQGAVDGNVVTGLLTERVTKAGTRINVSLTLSSILDDAGDCIGVSSIIRDVTEQTQLQAKFVQAQKMEAIGQLAGGVAHDLNNFLTSMLIGIEFACESAGVDDETRAHFASVREDGFRSANLVRQLLTVARRQVLSPQPCELGNIVRETLPVLRSVLGADIAIVTSLDAARGAHIDPAQIGQALLNLAINARDAMPGGGTLTISTDDSAQGDQVLLRVSDVGCGMTPDVKAHLFEPFFTTKVNGTGTGLGLSTTYGIVVQSHGTIAVESEPGVGTTFTMSFPAIDPPAVVSPPSRGSAKPSPLAGSNRARNETILIVEDDRVVRDGLARGLGRLGYQVLEAQNGRDALIVLRDRPDGVHLVLSDLVMPGMNGVDLVTHIRAKFPAMHTMLMSGYSERALGSFGTPIPGTTLIAKPFELSVLAATIRQELDRKNSECAA